MQWNSYIYSVEWAKNNRPTMKMKNKFRNYLSSNEQKITPANPKLRSITEQKKEKRKNGWNWASFATESSVERRRNDFRYFILPSVTFWTIKTKWQQQSTAQSFRQFHNSNITSLTTTNTENWWLHVHTVVCITLKKKKQKPNEHHKAASGKMNEDKKKLKNKNNEKKKNAKQTSKYKWELAYSGILRNFVYR